MKIIYKFHLTYFIIDVEAESRMFCIFVRTANHAFSFNSGFKVCFSMRLPEGNCTQVLIKSCGRLFFLNSVDLIFVQSPTISAYLLLLTKGFSWCNLIMRNYYTRFVRKMCERKLLEINF